MNFRATVRLVIFIAMAALAVFMWASDVQVMAAFAVGIAMGVGFDAVIVRLDEDVP